MALLVPPRWQTQGTTTSSSIKKTEQTETIINTKNNDNNRNTSHQDDNEQEYNIEQEDKTKLEDRDLEKNIQH